MADVRLLTRDEARTFLLAHLGLRRVVGRGARGVRAMLERIGCVQLDPLDPMGTNADLVALARVDGISVGDVYKHLLPGYAFEHYAKERCLLPASAFPYYRDRGEDKHWWSHNERLRRCPPDVVRAVLDEVSTRGPVAADDVTDRGRVERLDWAGWKGTPKASKMALEILWNRCQVVVCGRSGARGKIYDVPGRALPEVASAPGGDFDRWALLHRVRSAGLLARSGGSLWSMLSGARERGLADLLIEEGSIEEVKIEGVPRPYLVEAGALRRKIEPDDDRLRIIAPLDPVIWDRRLLAEIFDFDYIWEVYKPPKLRRWGWYVHPLLHRGRFVGRLEGRIDGGALVVDKLWREPGRFPSRALDEALERHAAACGVGRIVRPRKA